MEPPNPNPNQKATTTQGPSPARPPSFVRPPMNAQAGFRPQGAPVQRPFFRPQQGPPSQTQGQAQRPFRPSGFNPRPSIPSNQQSQSGSIPSQSNGVMPRPLSRPPFQNAAPQSGFRPPNAGNTGSTFQRPLPMAQSSPRPLSGASTSAPVAPFNRPPQQYPASFQSPSNPTRPPAFGASPAPVANLNHSQSAAIQPFTPFPPQNSNTNIVPNQANMTQQQHPAQAMPNPGYANPGSHGIPSTSPVQTSPYGVNQPQYQQQGLNQPQYQQQVTNQPYTPMAGQPNYGGYNGNIQDPSQMGNMMPNGQVPGITGHFANMNLSGAAQPVGVNLFAQPPPISAFHEEPPTPNTPPAVTNSPFSNSGPEYKRCTLNSIPQTASLLAKSRLPFGILITPFRHLLDGDEPVPVIQTPQIVRCRRCRTYINPWVQFVDQGSRWKCNMCFLTNDVPTFFDWDPENRNRVDRMTRAELTHGVVEFVAPQEYMVRPPQPVVFLFVIDVSYGAVQSGMVATAARAILESLDGIPNNDDRAKIGFITFDSTLHFYNLAASSSDPQMLVVSDLEQPYIPIPYDLLVSLTESRSVIELFLKKLPVLFGSTQQTSSALGKALKFAEKMIGSIGGKIICLQHSLPNQDDGSLKMREDPKILGTSKENAILQPAIPFYKNFAVECSPSQISIDVFLFNSQYADIATLSGCAKFTGGAVYYYPGFNGSKLEDSLKFSRELSHLMTRPLGLEAVLRIRASKGIKMTTFHGNFFLRSTDLLSLPNVNPDNSYTIELSITEDLLKSASVCFQTALLYTSSSGERRIRVLTFCAPVTTSLSELYSNADQRAIAALLVKKAIDRSLTSKLEDAREALIYKIAELISIYKSSFNQGSHPQQLMIASNLQLLPVYILGMIKNIFLRDVTTIPSDMRSYALSWLYASCPEISLVNIYPRLWSLQDLFENSTVGLVDQTGVLIYPQLLNLSSEKLNRNNIFLLENGQELFLWIGRSCSPEMLMAVFGQPSAEAIPLGKGSLPRLENDFSRRLHNLIDDARQLRLKQSTINLQLYIAREDADPALRLWFLSYFIEDRIDNNLSYPQFLASIREKVQKMKF